MRHVLILLCLLLACSITRGQEESGSPSFGAGVSLPELILELSPQGSFAIDIHDSTDDSSASESDQIAYQITLWDLRDDELKINPAPASTIIVNYTSHPTIGAAINTAFSPDDQFYAVRTDDAVRVFTLPELEIIKRIPSVITESIFIDEVKWSQDSRYLAFASERGTITVWDSQTDTLLTQRTDMGGPITAIEDGWLVQFTLPPSGHFSRVFVSCTTRLEECTTYTLEDLPITVERYTAVVAASNGGAILTRLKMPDSRTIYWMWRQQPDGSWLPDDTYAPIQGTTSSVVVHPDSRSDILSPDGRYLEFISCQQIASKAEDGSIITQRNCDKHIWDTVNWTKIHTFSQSCGAFKFFPNNSNYILCESSLMLSIYRVGEEDALDEIALEDVYDVPEQGFFVNFIITEDSSQLMLSVEAYEYGQATLVIPIEYQDE